MFIKSYICCIICYVISDNTEYIFSVCFHPVTGFSYLGNQLDSPYEADNVNTFHFGIFTSPTSSSCNECQYMCSRTHNCYAYVYFTSDQPNENWRYHCMGLTLEAKQFSHDSTVCAGTLTACGGKLTRYPFGY